MPVTILQVSDNTLEVNDKVVYRDTNDNWIAQSELTPSESKSLHQHIKSLEN